MLGKLLKYEIKATARWFLPIYIALAVLAAVNRLFWSASIRTEMFDGPYSSIFVGLLSLLLFGLIFALGIVSAIIMVQRFYKNLLGDEGYLMFTLPVSPANNINCKLLVSMMWCVVSVLLLLLIGYFTVYSMRDYDFMQYFMEEFDYQFRRIFEELETPPAVLALEAVAAGLLTLACGILQVYAAVAVGHLANNHRVLIAFGAYIGLNWAQQLFIRIITTTLGLWRDNNWWLYYDGGRMAHYSMWINVGLQVLFGIGMYALTAAVLTKRLNLE